jgi:hypothetical protein
MELLSVFDEVLVHLDVAYCITVVFLAYALRGVTADVLIYLRFPVKHVKTFAVFFIATIAAFVWHFLVGTDLVKLFVSYSATTTLYELFLKQIINKKS